MIKSKPIFEFDKIYNNAPKSVVKGHSLIQLIYSLGDDVKMKINKSVVVLNKNDIFILDGEAAVDIKSERKGFHHRISERIGWQRQYVLMFRCDAMP